MPPKKVTPIDPGVFTILLDKPVLKAFQSTEQRFSWTTAPIVEQDKATKVWKLRLAAGESYTGPMIKERWQVCNRVGIEITRC